VFSRFVAKTIFILFVSGIVFFAKPSDLVFAQTSDEQITTESNAYTLMPMFLPQAKPGLNYEDLLVALTKDQGYEAHCGGTQWVIEKTLWGDISKFFSENTPPLQSFYNGLNPTIFSGNDQYLVDFTKARVPLFRGMEIKTETLKNSSFEGMFGANFQQTADSYMLNSAGVSKRLLSAHQQCLVKIQNTLASIQICNEAIDEPCTLNKIFAFQIAVDENGQSRTVTSTETLKANEHLVDVTFDNGTLMSWIGEIRPELSGEELYTQVCTDITGGDSSAPAANYTPPAVGVDKIAKLREAMNRIPIDLDSLYRLAFLVLVPRQDKGKTVSDDPFYFLQSSPQVDDYVHAPIFIAFKIPEFGTNKSVTAGNVDTLELAKMVIQAKEQNDKDLEDQKSKRAEIYELAKAAPYADDSIINCPASYPQCARSDENALRNTLIDIINGTAPDCTNTTLRIVETETAVGDLNATESTAGTSGIEQIFNQEDTNWEKAGDIFTPASKDIKDYTYNSLTNKTIVDTLTSQGANPFEWSLTIDEDPPELDDNVIVNAYLVIPIGETIKDVNKALSIFWNEEEFFELVRTNVIEDMKNKAGVIPKYYTVKGANVGIDASDSISPPDECHYEEVLKENSSGGWYTETIQVCKDYTFGVTLEEKDKNILLPDFGLGFMIRKIQQKLRNSFSQTYNYILSCNRVEDMFLGRCSGDPKGTAQSFCNGEAFENIKNLPDAGQIPQFAKDVFTADIAARITPELIEAYEYAEQETGIPCEVVAGIHWTEGGLNANQSVHDGGALRGGSLKEDAKSAMEHLVGKFSGNFDRNNIEYEALVEAIGNYNGIGNQNCSRETRWLNGGKCPPTFFSEDHPHPLAYIDERHSDMDLIYCLDYVEFNCSVSPTASTLASLRSSLDEKQTQMGFTDETKESLIEQAGQYCYAGSNVCQNFSDGSQYPRYERPGSLTTAILLHESGL
jgi:hypothetical protein